MDDQRKGPEDRRGAPCPLPYALVLVGERFGGWPWELENQPAARVLFYLNLLGIEGEAKTAMAGLEPDEAFYRED